MLRCLDGLLRAQVQPRSIAIARAMLAIALVILTLEMSAVMYGLSDDGKFLYPPFEGMPRPPQVAPYVVLVAGLGSSICLLLGLLPNFMAATGAALGMVTLLWDQQTYSSHLALLTILLTLLAFAGSGRRLVLPRYRQEGDTVPFWPQLLMMTQVSVVYLFAGLSKVQPTFLGGDPLEGWMWPDLPHWMFVVLAWATVVTEVGLAVALWIPKVRAVAVVVGVSLHLSIIVLLSDQNLWLVAFGLTTTAVYPLFLTRPPLRVLAGRSVSDSPTAEVTG